MMQSSTRVFGLSSQNAPPPLPKIGPAGLILAECFAKSGLGLPKLVPRTTCAAKIGRAGPILAAKTGPPLLIFVPPVKYKSATI